MIAKSVRRSEPPTLSDASDSIGAESDDQKRAGSMLTWCREHAYVMTRCTLGLIFIWFGALKVAGMSPAAELVKQTFFFVPGNFIVPLLGVLEVLIGGCFLIKKAVGLGLIMLAFHLPGTFLSFFVVPERCFVRFPFVLTTEGEFILKNLVIISAGISLVGLRRERSP